MKTLIEIRDILRNAGRFDIPGTDEQACDLADAIDAHLSAQAKVRATLEDAQAVHAAIMTSSGSYEDGSIHLGVDDVMHGLESFAARLSQGAQGEAAIGDLLAIIHRDGGHYQSDHGTEKAARDAVDVVNTMKQQLAERAAVPDGWKITRTDDAIFPVRIAGPEGHVWHPEGGSPAARLALALLTAAPQPPEGARVCATCHDGGVVRKDGFFGTTFEPCPDCTDKGE